MVINSSPQLILPDPAETNQGIALIDKPSGISSHYVVNHLRHRFGLKRIGHAGTLDPLATGLLICLLGRSFTKLQAQFLKQPKVYDCEFSLGFTTDTYDRTGQKTTEAEWPKISQISKTQVEAVLADMIGSQTQRIPAFSAVKVRGEKMYQKVLKDPNLDLATLPVRTVVITELTLLDWKSNSTAQTLTGSLRVACSSGTYVRSIVHDLGQKLGVGACVMELRRLSIGKWNVKDAAEISDENVPLYQAIEDLPTSQN